MRLKKLNAILKINRQIAFQLNKNNVVYN